MAANCLQLYLQEKRRPHRKPKAEPLLKAQVSLVQVPGVGGRRRICVAQGSVRQRHE